jgi:hypothetical protein
MTNSRHARAMSALGERRHSNPGETRCAYLYEKCALVAHREDDDWAVDGMSMLLGRFRS